MKIPAVILAAGASTRLGRPKQLVEIGGETLLHRTARLALDAGCDPVLVVLGHEAESMKKVLQDLDVCPITNLEWTEGMASSIRAGISALPSDAEASLLLLCDQPAVDMALLRHLLERHANQPESPVACVYGNSRGIPALFPRSCFNALLHLRGDRGAKILLSGPEVLGIPFPGGEWDVDKPEDLSRS